MAKNSSRDLCHDPKSTKTTTNIDNWPPLHPHLTKNRIITCPPMDLTLPKLSVSTEYFQLFPTERSDELPLADIPSVLIFCESPNGFYKGNLPIYNAYNGVISFEVRCPTCLIPSVKLGILRKDETIFVAMTPCPPVITQDENSRELLLNLLGNQKCVIQVIKYPTSGSTLPAAVRTYWNKFVITGKVTGEKFEVGYYCPSKNSENSASDPARKNSLLQIFRSKSKSHHEKKQEIEYNRKARLRRLGDLEDTTTLSRPFPYMCRAIGNLTDEITALSNPYAKPIPPSIFALIIKPGLWIFAIILFSFLILVLLRICCRKLFNCIMYYFI